MFVEYFLASVMGGDSKAKYGLSASSIICVAFSSRLYKTNAQGSCFTKFEVSEVGGGVNIIKTNS